MAQREFLKKKKDMIQLEEEVMDKELKECGLFEDHLGIDMKRTLMATINASKRSAKEELQQREAVKNVRNIMAKTEDICTLDNDTETTQQKITDSKPCFEILSHPTIKSKVPEQSTKSITSYPSTSKLSNGESSIKKPLSDFQILSVLEEDDDDDDDQPSKNLNVYVNKVSGNTLHRKNLRPENPCDAYFKSNDEDSINGSQRIYKQISNWQSSFLNSQSKLKTYLGWAAPLKIDRKKKQIIGQDILDESIPKTHESDDDIFSKRNPSESDTENRDDDSLSKKFYTVNTNNGTCSPVLKGYGRTPRNFDGGFENPGCKRRLYDSPIHCKKMKSDADVNSSQISQSLDTGEWSGGKTLRTVVEKAKARWAETNASEGIKMPLTKFVPVKRSYMDPLPKIRPSLTQGSFKIDCPPKVECPLCLREFNLSDIEAHASDCTGGVVEQSTRTNNHADDVVFIETSSSSTTSRKYK